MTTLLVSEVFGPTVQGEGPSTGRCAWFLRLALCNLDCSWCDTPYTWDWSGKNGTAYDRHAETRSESLDSLVAQLTDADLLVVTGGEPLVQQQRLAPLLHALVARGVEVEVETNGTLLPVGMPEEVRYNVSPKLASSHVDPERAHVPEVLEWHADHDSAWKFVVDHAGALGEVDTLMDALDVSPARVWIMPEGRSSVDVMQAQRDLVDAVVERGYNLSTRLHVLLWGDRRGV